MQNKQNSQLFEAAEKYAEESFVPMPNKAGEQRALLVGHTHPFGYRKHFNAAKKHFIAGITCEAAKNYWFEQFKSEQKQQISDESIEALAEKEYESLTAPNYFSDGIKSKFITAFIKGFKAALNNSADGWVKSPELPEKTNDYYLCFDKINKSVNSYYFNNQKHFLDEDGYDITKIITHWQPLPKPPSSKEQKQS